MSSHDFLSIPNPSHAHIFSNHKMHMLDIFGAVLTATVAPLVVTLAIGTKIVYFVPLLVKWKFAQEVGPKGLELVANEVVEPLGT